MSAGLDLKIQEGKNWHKNKLKSKEEGTGEERWKELLCQTASNYSQGFLIKKTDNSMGVTMTSMPVTHCYERAQTEGAPNILS